MMNPKIKAAWVEALRSGRYSQGVNYLKKRSSENRSYEFCCLGVLCDLQNVPIVPSLAAIVTFDFDGEEETTSLTEDFEDKVGLTIHETCHLMEMNDGGKSFNKIADWIEANL